MRKHPLSLKMNLLAACLAVGGLTWSASPVVADEQKDKQSSSASQSLPDGKEHERKFSKGQVTYGVLSPQKQEQLPEGFEKKQVQNADQIQKLFANTAQALFQESQVEQLLENFTLEDNQRLMESFSREGKLELTDALNKVKQTFKEKYNQDLDLNQEVALFNREFTIYQGELEDPMLLANWPVNAKEQGNAPLRQKEGDQQHRIGDKPKHGESGHDDQQKDRQASGEKKHEKDSSHAAAQSGEAKDSPALTPMKHEAAVVLMPGSEGMDETYISLLKQEGQWKIDIPDNINADQFSKNLSSHLEKLSKKENLPEKQEEAFASFVHHVFAAAYETEGEAETVFKASENVEADQQKEKPSEK